MMSKKIFVLVVVLMSISLVGIIAVQVYWIEEALKTKRQQFENDVKIALARTSEAIKENEYSEFVRKNEKFFENDKFRTDAEIKNYLFQQVDTLSKQKFTFGATILEENFKIPVDFVNHDSIIVKRFSGKEDTFFTKIVTSKNRDFKSFTEESSFTSFKNYSSLNKRQMEYMFNQSKQILPIHKRISSRLLKEILEREFAKRNIHQDFKFGLYEDGLATSIKSGYFKFNPEDDYFYPLLENEKGNSKYKLYVSFPDENKNIFSGILKVLLLSVLFIGIIIAAFSTSIYQLVRQKKISEIKTDFINNMTHEFKTPIATINLALDAIRNPKVIDDNEKVKRYIKMIKDENKRMHGQVENVLQISRLEKKQLDIRKEPVEVNEIIEDAIDHVRLLVSDKKGTIDTHFEAISKKILGNKFHLTNGVVNILENAIKYSDKPPKIDVYTACTNKYFILKVKDQGIGMSKNAQKYIFDKFYRELKGNIHDVKGHGLGLAYVKEIVDNHQGSIHVESEKGKGSTFIVKLPKI